MYELKMQDLVTIAAGEARSETMLRVVRAVIGQYSPDVKLLREILDVKEPPVPSYMKKDNTEVLGRKNEVSAFSENYKTEEE